MITLYIGYDSNNYGQELAFEVCKRSVLRFNKYINIIKLNKKDLQDKRIYLRTNDSDASTEFTYTRFLVPFLNNYEGYAIFCDSDFIWRCNLDNIKQYFNKSKAVACVQHEYIKCNNNLKMDGLKQEWYPRKNWSSLMVFNCGHPDCKNLSITSIANQTPQWLHRMEWTTDDNVDSIPKTYNYLLGYYNDEEEPNAVHLTDGGPWHNDWYNNKIFKDDKYEIEWIRYLNDYEKDNLQDFLNK
jgi:hypothetical protein